MWNYRKGNRILIIIKSLGTTNCAYATLRQSVADLMFRNVSFNFATAISKFDNFSSYHIVHMYEPKRAIYHYWKWATHFQYWHPLPVLSFFGSHLRKFSIWWGTQTGNLPLLVLGVTHFVPFPVLSYAISGTVIHWAPYRNWAHTPVPFPVRGSASSGTVIHWAPYRNWALCAWSHFRYGALPVPVQSFTEVEGIL